MFELTRREQLLVACVLGILLLGLGVRHWREAAALEAPLAEIREVRNDE